MRAVLLCDFREGRANQSVANTHVSTGAQLIKHLHERNVPCIYTALPSGDYAWASLPPAAFASLRLGGAEPHVKVRLDHPALDALLMLGVVAERKSVSDLVGSLIDGRFENQKATMLALRRPGDPPPHYILEENSEAVMDYKNAGQTDHSYTPPIVRGALLYARGATLGQGFAVLRTRSIVETAAVLAAQLPLMQARAAAAGAAAAAAAAGGGGALRSFRGWCEAARAVVGGRVEDDEGGVEDVSTLEARVFCCEEGEGGV